MDQLLRRLESLCEAKKDHLYIYSIVKSLSKNAGKIGGYFDYRNVEKDGRPDVDLSKSDVTISYPILMDDDTEGTFGVNVYGYDGNKVVVSVIANDADGEELDVSGKNDLEKEIVVNSDDVKPVMSVIKGLAKKIGYIEAD